jgi:hypothetical protein
VSETTRIVEIILGEEDLPLLSELRVTPDVEVHDARPVSSSGDLYFDPGQMIDGLLSATAVISSVGGTASVLRWITSEVSRRKGTIEVRVGTTRIRIEPGDDPERARALLEEALRP